MCEGEIRRLLIPADLAYGQLGLPNSVPGNTAVVYEVEMLYVNSPFSNPWFWTGLSLLVLAFIFSSKFNRMGDAFKSAKFLESKEAAITNRGSSKITKTD
ncbi:hypothetical protein BDF20DRAFT_365575 [Mycotypha africana]|uniref:uncharacterized protein n=1 Tax=Mycotypha africana TaxID=64632 RepID=UPI0022FFD85F|nr:uncharacterized protein BDF20DRAFT_365575 [Mycotypha africana]KAI8984100.1 hypothetical protein BDF20DRAFT_365575 [Mycotypha africana]